MKTRRLVIALLCLLASASTCYAEQGRVVDATTGIGVAEATVTLGDPIVETDADGRFQGAAGTVPVQARAAGYWAATMSAATFWQGNATLRLTPFRPKALYLSFYGVGSQTIRDAALKLIHDAKLNAVSYRCEG